MIIGIVLMQLEKLKHAVPLLSAARADFLLKSGECPGIAWFCIPRCPDNHIIEAFVSYSLVTSGMLAKHSFL